MRDFEADRKLCDAATSGPWIATSVEICEAKENETGLRHNVIAGSVAGREKWFSRNDAEFIADARDGWSDALKRIAELEAENAALRAELQAAVVTVNNLTNYCELCKNEGCGLTMCDCIKYWRGVWAKSAKGGE